MCTRLLIPLLPLLLLVTCCTAHPPPGPEPAPLAHVEQPEPLYTGPRLPDPPDPCVVGTVIRSLGWNIVVPVPCDPLWIDKGDPPPEASAPVEDRVDPGLRAVLPSERAGALLRR
jgi:hypothetical protein